MALNVSVDQNQLPPFSGTLSSAKWTVEDVSDGGKVKTILASQIAGAGTLSIIKITAPGGDTISLSSLSGQTIDDVGRPGQGSCGFILTGELDIPTGVNLKWYDGVLSYPVGSGPLAGEILTIYSRS
jgi:hypothetical protein